MGPGQLELRRPDDADQGDRRRGLYIAGDEIHNGARLIKDKVAVLGPNAKVKVVVTDGFVFRSLLREAGPAAMEGIVGTSPAAPADRLGGAAGRFLGSFARTEGDVPIHDWTIFAAGATQVLLDAIARSDGTRKDVVKKLFATDGAKTVLGPMSFDGNGDPKFAGRGAVPGDAGQVGLRRLPELRVEGQDGQGRRDDQDHGPARGDASRTRRLLRAVPAESRPLHG